MSHIGSTFNRILQAVQLAEGVVGSAGLVLVTLLMFAQVLNRYLLHFEIMVLGDLALYLFVFFMLVAAAFTTWREGHIAVDYFRDRALKGRPRGIAIHRASLVVISIALTCVFLSPAYKFMLRAIRYPEWGTLVRWFNLSWLHITLFVAAALILVHLLVIARRDIDAVMRNYRPGYRREKT